jgi:hypothetical protein
VLILGTAPNWSYLAISCVLTFVVFVCAYFTIKRLEPFFADAV